MRQKGKRDILCLFNLNINKNMRARRYPTYLIAYMIVSIIIVSVRYYHAHFMIKYARSRNAKF